MVGERPGGDWQAADVRMTNEYGKQVADGKLVFDLEAGQDVLVQEYIPVKMRLKAMGPFKFLRAIRSSGAEVLDKKGEIRRAAMANLKTYHPPIAGENLVVTKPRV